MKRSRVAMEGCGHWRVTVGLKPGNVVRTETREMNVERME